MPLKYMPCFCGTVNYAVTWDTAADAFPRSCTSLIVHLGEQRMADSGAPGSWPLANQHCGYWWSKLENGRFWFLHLKCIKLFYSRSYSSCYVLVLTTRKLNYKKTSNFLIPPLVNWSNRYSSKTLLQPHYHGFLHHFFRDIFTIP